MYIILPILIFALFDFFGYNISVKKKWVDGNFINPYRIIQTIVQLLIFILTWVFAGFMPAGIFLLLWWTWTADWIYYFFCLIFGWIFGITSEWKQPFKNVVTWAWWTPYGLLTKQSPINWTTLILQTIIGIIITWILLII